MSNRRKRPYNSRQRTDAAGATRNNIVNAAQWLFGRKGIDKVTVADIAARADVAVPTVYANFKSKDGILREIMKRSLFGGQFQSAQGLLQGVDDPVRLIELTAQVARAIYESESKDLGLLRHASGFSPALRRIEQEFEQLRYDMQGKRIQMLFESGMQRKSLTLEEARRILWMLTARDPFRMLVLEGGWTADRYQAWLSRTLLEALVEQGFD